MPNTAIKITGLAEVQQMLRETPRHVAVLGLAKALNAGGTVLAGAVYHACPETDEGSRSGQAADGGVPHLKDEIQLEVNVDTNGNGGRAEVHFGKMEYLAAWIELGHKRVGHKPGKRLLGFQKPDPFIRNAADQSANDAIAAFEQSFGSSCDEYFRP